MHQYTQPSTKTNLLREGSTQDVQHSWRCDCGRLLFKGAFLVGIIEVKCPRCKRIVYLQELNSFTTCSKSGMVIIGMDGTLLSANKGFSSSLGYPDGSLIGKNISTLVSNITEPIINYWIRKMKSMSSNPNPYVVALFSLKNKDGKEVELSFFAKHIILEDRPAILVISEEDKGAFKRYESKFRNGDSSYPLMHTAWDFIVDKNGSILSSNPNGILGHSPRETTGKNLLDYISESTLKDDLRKRIGSDPSFVGKARMRSSTGELIHVELALTPDQLSKEGECDISVSLIKQ